MGIVKIISGLLGLAEFFTRRAERQGLMEQGAAQATLKGLEKSRDEIQKVMAARRAVHSDAEYRRRVRERARRDAGDG